jgi:4-hydroxy-tetrahydrodipicolinate reductase
MGQEVCRAVSSASGMLLVAAVDPGAAGVTLRSLAGNAVPELVVEDSLDALIEARVQIVVDFTVAEAARETLPWCAARGIHAVVGTTGLDQGDLDALSRAFDGRTANAVVAPNFAIGAVLLMKFCEMAAPYMRGAEIIELHHDEKRDAPSGTALHTAEVIDAARRRAGAGSFAADPTTRWMLEGARGGEGPGGVRVHSVRLQGLVAHEEVLFGAPGQTLTVRHDSYDRRSFMDGVLVAVRAVPGRPGLTVGLEGILGL